MSGRGRAIRRYALVLILLVLPAYASAPPIPWDHKIADAIFRVMKANSEAYWTIGKSKIPITIVYLAEIVDETYEASKLNPGWGNQEQATKRLLVAIYTQSRFYKLAYNEKLNKDGSKDIGIAQINNSHFATKKGDWFKFCREMGFKSRDPGQLWDSSINILFMAWYNQRALENDQSCYHFNRTKDQKRLYQALLKVN